MVEVLIFMEDEGDLSREKLRKCTKIAL